MKYFKIKSILVAAVAVILVASAVFVACEKMSQTSAAPDQTINKERKASYIGNGQDTTIYIGTCGSCTDYVHCSIPNGKGCLPEVIVRPKKQLKPQVFEAMVDRTLPDNRQMVINHVAVFSEILPDSWLNMIVHGNSSLKVDRHYSQADTYILRAMDRNDNGNYVEAGIAIPVTLKD